MVVKPKDLTQATPKQDKEITKIKNLEAENSKLKQELDLQRITSE